VCENRLVKPPQAKHKWTFKARFRSRAFGYTGSNLACHRLKEAVAEIKKLAKSDPVQAAEGAVFLMEKIWPALEQVDSSSGSLGSTVYWALTELLPIVIDAQADRKTRDRWLDRLYQAIQEDGVDYLDRVKDDWGPLCGSVEMASQWADQFLPLLKTVWSDPRPGNYLRETVMCLSCLLAAGRHTELFEVLALHRRQDWNDRKFGVRALLAEGMTEKALDYAEGSRGLNQPDAAIDAACERILLEGGRDAEAYEKYGLTANESSTGLATFRRISKKYPAIDPRRILLDLAESCGDRGRWFAAAKDAGMLDLALHFAQTGSTDPRTLSRAARDLIETDARFCLQVGRIALQRMADNYGYDLTGLDVMEACTHFIRAAEKLGVAEDARNDVLSMGANAKRGSTFANALRVAMS
jgi:hypothetical protein